MNTNVETILSGIRTWAEDKFAQASALDDKQDKLTAGDNITISAANVISAEVNNADTLYLYIDAQGEISGQDMEHNLPIYQKICEKYEDGTLDDYTFRAYCSEMGIEGRPKQILCNELTLRIYFNFILSGKYYEFRIDFHRNDETCDISSTTQYNLQRRLTAGDGIEISSDYVISAKNNFLGTLLFDFNSTFTTVTEVSAVNIPIYHKIQDWWTEHSNRDFIINARERDNLDPSAVLSLASMYIDSEMVAYHLSGIINGKIIEMHVRHQCEEETTEITLTTKEYAPDFATNDEIDAITA